MHTRSLLHNSRRQLFYSFGESSATACSCGACSSTSPLTSASPSTSSVPAPPCLEFLNPTQQIMKAVTNQSVVAAILVLAPHERTHCELTAAPSPTVCAGLSLHALLLRKMNVKPWLRHVKRYKRERHWYPRLGLLVQMTQQFKHKATRPKTTIGDNE